MILDKGPQAFGCLVVGGMRLIDHPVHGTDWLAQLGCMIASVVHDLVVVELDPGWTTRATTRSQTLPSCSATSPATPTPASNRP